MRSYELDIMKIRKRNFLVVFFLALLPLISLTGYRLFSIIVELAGSMKDGDIISGVIAFLLRIFVETIVLIIISVIWIAICCYIPLKKLHGFYCENIFTQAVLRNSEYSYVHYTERLLNTAELVKAKIIPPYTSCKQKEAEYLVGRYKNIDFEIAPLTLSYGKGPNEEIDGSIVVFTGLASLFHNEDFVQVSCSTDEDVFAEYLPQKRGLEVKKKISMNHNRNCLFIAPKNQRISEEQFVLLEHLVRELSEQVRTHFYIIFAQSQVYFINNDKSLIINLPLWHSIEREIQDVEKNGIVNINLFINTFIRAADGLSAYRR